MTVEATSRARLLRCSAVTQRLDSRPGATAGSFDSVLLVARPLPWPRDVGDDPQLAPIVDAIHSGRAATGRTRLQAIVPDDAPELTLYRRPPGAFSEYARFEPEADARSAIDRALALVEGEPAQPATAEGATDHDVVEILVCTHGRRDACCGSLGPAVHRQLTDIYAGSSDVRLVRRTSHLGGHRFAPTVAVMPSGTLWAWVDAELMQGIVEHTAPIEVATRHYRGSMGLDLPEIQALDAALLADHGWAWLARARTASVLERADGAALVQLDHTDGERRWTSTATVNRARNSPIPTCGVALDGTEKTQPEWTVGAISTRAA